MYKNYQRKRGVNGESSSGTGGGGGRNGDSGGGSGGCWLIVLLAADIDSLNNNKSAVTVSVFVMVVSKSCFSYALSGSEGTICTRKVKNKNKSKSSAILTSKLILWRLNWKHSGWRKYQYCSCKGNLILYW